MNWEYSCGSIVFTRRNGQILYVIVQEMEGAYSFPKGHMEGDETETETARREVFEEIGLHPVFLDGFRLQDEYALAEKPGTWKRVTYFLSEFTTETLVPREGEIRGIQLLPFEEAIHLFEHEGTRQLFTKAHAYLSK